MKVYYYKNPGEWALNWGDIIAPDIIAHFSKSKKLEVTNDNKHNKLVSVGSVMNAVQPYDFVWGTGVIKPGIIGGSGSASIYAVRGPKTRDELIKNGIKCPAIYGDPALLYPQIYTPEKIEKTHEWGLIPHYIDVNHPGVEKLKQRGFKIIDILAGKKEFVDQLHSVEKVLSSSLHGLIAADSYGIPNARISFTDKIVGGDFKYMDYSLSVNRNTWKSIDGNAENILVDSVPLNHSINWDPNKLLENSPWLDPKNKDIFY